MMTPCILLFAALIPYKGNFFTLLPGQFVPLRRPGLLRRPFPADSLFFLLPANRRAILRGPALFLALYPILCAVRLLFPWGTPLRPLFGYVALFFFLSSLGRTLFLAVEVVLLEANGPAAAQDRAGPGAALHLASRLRRRLARGGSQRLDASDGLGRAGAPA